MGNHPEIDGGFVILARKMLTSGIMKKPHLHLSLWVWMLLQASHKDHGSLKRGQFFTSIEKMREAMSYKIGYRKVIPTRKQIRVAYESLIKGTMIDTTKGTQGMLVTILNYDKYQNPVAYERHGEGHDENPLGGTIKTRRDNKKKEYACPLFTSFWGSYPRKTSKKDAWKVWTKLKVTEDLLNRMLADIRRRCQSGEWHSGNKTYIPYPATYLRGERWLDEEDSEFQEQPLSVIPSEEFLKEEETHALPAQRG